MPEFVGLYVGDQQPRIATVLINREPTNALTRQVYRELAQAAAEVSDRDDIASVIIFFTISCIRHDSLAPLREVPVREA